MYFHNELRCHLGLLTTLGKEDNFKNLAYITNKETYGNKAFSKSECLELVCKIGFLSKYFKSSFRNINEKCLFLEHFNCVQKR